MKINYISFQFSSFWFRQILITCLESADVSSLGLSKHDFESELRNRNKMKSQPFFYDEWFKCNKIFSENIGILLMSAKRPKL